MNVIRKYRKETLLVHCSAGVGRTGVFMLLDIVIDSIALNVKVSIILLSIIYLFYRLCII